MVHHCQWRAESPNLALTPVLLPRTGALVVMPRHGPLVLDYLGTPMLDALMYADAVCLSSDIEVWNLM